MAHSSTRDGSLHHRRASGDADPDATGRSRDRRQAARMDERGTATPEERGGQKQGENSVKGSEPAKDVSRLLEMRAFIDRDAQIVAPRLLLASGVTPLNNEG